MTDFLQLFFSGLSTGAIYALAALGFTLLWQASGTINFAQGEFVMLPAFIMLGFNMAGLPLLASFLLSCLVAVFLLGWVFKRGLVDPLFRYGMMPIVVATIGLSIAMRNGVRAGYSAEAHPFPSLFADKIYNVAGVAISLADIGTFVLALVLVVGVAAKKLGLLAEANIDLTFDGKRNTLLSADPVSADPKLGLELNISNVFYLRGGINNFQRALADGDTLNQKKVWIYQPSLGAGFKFGNVELDYSYSNLANQSNPLYSHVFSLRLNLAKKQN